MKVDDVFFGENIKDHLIFVLFLVFPPFLGINLFNFFIDVNLLARLFFFFFLWLLSSSYIFIYWVTIIILSQSVYSNLNFFLICPTLLQFYFLLFSEDSSSFVYLLLIPFLFYAYPKGCYCPIILRTFIIILPFLTIFHIFNVNDFQLFSKSKFLYLKCPYISMLRTNNRMEIVVDVI